MKFYVRTYGCQMNVADSSEMGRHLKARGLVETQDPDEASVFLVNTCTVRQHAEDRAFSEIGRLKKWKAKGPGRKIVVTGCAAERTKDRVEASKAKLESDVHNVEEKIADIIHRHYHEQK